MNIVSVGRQGRGTAFIIALSITPASYPDQSPA